MSLSKQAPCSSALPSASKAVRNAEQVRVHAILYIYDLHHNFGRASTFEKFNPQVFFTIQTLHLVLFTCKNFLRDCIEKLNMFNSRDSCDSCV